MWCINYILAIIFVRNVGEKESDKQITMQTLWHNRRTKLLMRHLFCFAHQHLANNSANHVLALRASSSLVPRRATSAAHYSIHLIDGRNCRTTEWMRNKSFHSTPLILNRLYIIRLCCCVAVVAAVHSHVVGEFLRRQTCVWLCELG